jgi:hypothetical protein
VIGTDRFAKIERPVTGVPDDRRGSRSDSH